MADGDEHLRRMLKDDGQRHDRLAGLSFQHEGARAGAEICAAGKHLVDDVHAGLGRLDRDVQAGLGVIAERLCGIVASELEVGHPFQLDRHRLEAAGNGFSEWRALQQQNGQRQPGSGTECHGSAPVLSGGREGVGH